MRSLSFVESGSAAGGPERTASGRPRSQHRARCRRLIALLMLGLFSSPVVGGGDGSQTGVAKIRFDMSVLDASGLYGPPDGLRALSYEFCIPNRPDTVAQVRSIDKSVAMHRARGRIGCTAKELLCIGHTHQPGYREVLAALSDLPYVVRIDQAFFE